MVSKMVLLRFILSMVLSLVLVALLAGALTAGISYLGDRRPPLPGPPPGRIEPRPTPNFKMDKSGDRLQTRKETVVCIADGVWPVMQTTVSSFILEV